MEENKNLKELRNELMSVLNELRRLDNTAAVKKR